MSQYTSTEVYIGASGRKVHVTLPVDINKVLKKQTLNSRDVSQQQYNEHVPGLETQFASFFKSSNKDSLISTYAYRLNKSTNSDATNVLDISPFQINNDSGSRLCSYSFQLPSNCVSNCIAVTESIAENAIVIDVILDMNVLVSLRLNIDAFFDSSNSTPTYSSNNFYSWCSYSMPYSFDQRIPLQIKSLDLCTSIVATADGGLLLMTRTSFESGVHVSPLSSTSYLSNIKSKIFGLKMANGGIDMLNFNGLQISSPSIIDIISITPDIFCTISIDKKLAFWSISAQNMVKEYHLNNYIDEVLSESYLSPLFPNSILKITPTGLLSVLLSLDTTHILVFSLDYTELELDLISNLTPPDVNSSWTPVDYDYLTSVNDGSCKFTISWMFSDSCYNKTCTIYSDSNNTVKWEDTIDFSQFDALKNDDFLCTIDTLSTIEDVNQYSLRFIESQYPADAIISSLKIFDSTNSKEFSTVTIENDIVDVITSNTTNTLLDLKNEWVKFTSVCHDIYRRSAIKTFAIAFDNSDIHSENPFLICLKSNDSYSIVKQASTFETLYFNRRDKRNINLQPFTYSNEVNNTELSKLVDLIIDYAKGYDDKMQTQLLEEIVSSNEETPKLMNTLFDKYIFSTANESVVSKLLSALSQIEDGSNLIQFLTILINTNFEEYRINTSSQFTDVSTNTVVKSIQSNNASAKKLIMGLTLVLLTLDYSKPLESLFIQNCTTLKYIHFIDLVSMMSKSTITSENLVSKYLSTVNHGVYVKNNTLNLIISNMMEQLCDDKFVYFVMAQFIHFGKHKDAACIIKYLPETPVSLVLQALLYLDSGRSTEAREILMKHANKIMIFDITGLAHSLSGVSDAVNLTFVTKETNYYFNVAILFEERKFYVEALEFAIAASKHLVESVNNEIEDTLVDDIPAKIFDISLKLNQFDMSFSAIKEMKHFNRGIPLKRFIYKLFQENNLNEVVQFDYATDFDFVDQLIFNLGEESLKNNFVSDIKLALKYYRVCYALRLKEGDFRGAIEVLYKFNRNVIDSGKNVDEVRYEILKNNYLVMLNLIKSLQKDDQWLIRYGAENEGNVVVTGVELEQEYITFTRKDMRQDVLEKRPLYLV